MFHYVRVGKTIGYNFTFVKSIENQGVPDIVIIQIREYSDMGFKKGINKCVECENKMKEDPNETGMCSKCGSAQTRIESTMYKELIDEGRFP